jgi:hypothetical protein
MGEESAGISYNIFFSQDLVSKRVTSFSCGNIWLYFFRETLIGVRDMEDDNRAYFLDVSKKRLENDHYTSQHLIDEKLVREAHEEAQASIPPKMVTKDEVARKAVQLCAESLHNLIHNTMMQDD